MGRAIGIDLGTTNSCATAFVDGEVVVITYENGASTIPSVFAVDRSGNSLIGHDALKMSSEEGYSTITASKRLLGRGFDSKQVGRHKQVFTYDLVEGDQSEILVSVANQILTLESVSAEILRTIKNNATRFLGEPVDKAVITVPAYFNDKQRHSVREAGRLAGLDVLRVLNEPTAAAIAYGFGKDLKECIAVYDLGGGTFDVSIININGQTFDVVATGGDTFLGGLDFDDKIMQHMLQEAADETGVDLSFDRDAVDLFRVSAESAKIALSTEEETTIIIEDLDSPDVPPGHTFEFILTRELLEDLTQDLVDRTISACSRILLDVDMTISQIDRFLVVGGQSRMPLVRREVTSFANRPLSTAIDADKGVAAGAAIMASVLSKDDKSGKTSKLVLHDVLPSAIGIASAKGQMHTLFAKNESLPAESKLMLTTHKDGQRSVKLKVYQGESQLITENERIGSFSFGGLPSKPKGGIKIEVKFDLDPSAILTITAKELSSGKSVKAQVAVNDGGERRRKKKKKDARKRKQEKNASLAPGRKSKKQLATEAVVRKTEPAQTVHTANTADSTSIIIPPLAALKTSTVKQLRSVAKEYGILQKGPKRDLINRLHAARTAASSDAEQPVATEDPQVPGRSNIPRKGAIGRKPIASSNDSATLPSRDSLRARRIEKTGILLTIWRWLASWLPWRS
jgi:molecular chaperone DnaK